MRAVGFALALYALLATGAPPAASAWGIEGHQIIADIAEKHLTPEVAKRVAEILQGARMRDVANYADENHRLNTADVDGLPSGIVGTEITYTPSPDGGVFHVITSAAATPRS